MPGRRADVPTYRELLARADGPPGSSWGVFGPDDQLGTLNFLTERATARAAGLVASGRVYNLDYPLNTFVPSIAGTRPAAEHHMFANNPNHRDDWLDSFYCSPPRRSTGYGTCGTRATASTAGSRTRPSRSAGRNSASS